MQQQGMPFSPAPLAQVPCLQTGEQSPKHSVRSHDQSLLQARPAKELEAGGVLGEGRPGAPGAGPGPPSPPLFRQAVLAGITKASYLCLRAGSFLRCQSEHSTQLLPAPACPHLLPSLWSLLFKEPQSGLGPQALPMPLPCPGSRGNHLLLHLQGAAPPLAQVRLLPACQSFLVQHLQEWPFSLWLSEHLGSLSHRRGHGTFSVCTNHVSPPGPSMPRRGAHA